MRASLSLHDFPWLEDVIGDGFRVYVGPSLATTVQSPVAAPNGAATFVKVTPSMRQLSARCAGVNQLSARRNFMHHDPEGASCAVSDATSTAQFVTKCTFAVYSNRPNSTVVCDPWSLFIGLTLVFTPDMEAFFAESSNTASVGASKVSFFFLHAFYERHFISVFQIFTVCFRLIVTNIVSG